MRVGIVGAGNVGQTLGGRLAARHAVKYGCRDPRKHADVDAAVVADAVGWAEVVILATPGFRTPAAAAALAHSLGPGVEGKVVIDATNPLSAWPQLEVLWSGASAGEMLQEALPSAYVFKAFNTIGFEHMAAPRGDAVFGGAAVAAERGPITMLFAGAPERKDAVAEVITDVGFDPRYVGPIRYARNLEALAELWIHTGIGGAGLNPGVEWGRGFAFQVVGGHGA
ncbi:MAG: hypothetical protein J3K34DRAFT_411055 [Monoraphidium minutum]|nr:MAG: hypothetical protein J3K34DRAFT_411055 [Monoraphidium minutum]